MAPASVFVLAIFWLAVKAETLAPRTFAFHLELQGNHPHHAQTADAHGGHVTGIPTHGPHTGHAHQGPGPHHHHVIPGHQHHVDSNAHQHAHQNPAHHHHILPGHQHQVGGNHHGHNHSHSSGSPVTSLPTSASGRPATTLICRVVEVTATPAVPASSHSGGGSFAHHNVFTNISASLKAVVGKVANPVVVLLHNASTWLNRPTHSGNGHHGDQHFSGVPVARLVRNKIMALFNRNNLVPGTTKTAVTQTFTTGAANHTMASPLAVSQPASRGSDATATRATTSRPLSTTTSPAHSAGEETTFPVGAITLGKPGAVSTDVSMPPRVPSPATRPAPVSGRSGQVFTIDVSNTSVSATDFSTRATTPIAPTYTTGNVTSTVTETTSPTSGMHRSGTTPFVTTFFAIVTRRLAMPTGQPSRTTRPVPLIFSDVDLRPFQR